MSSTRQDAWTQDEDLLLAEVVLRYIREGGTQLQAFEEVGKKLSRTAAACGFRWNSTIRKQYKTGIELAKKQRKEGKKSSNLEQLNEDILQDTSSYTEDLEEIITPPLQKELNFADILVYLNKMHERILDLQEYEENIVAYKEKVKVLEERVSEISAENMRLQKEFYTMENDYKALVEIMERARKMVVLKDEEFAQKVRFQMDKNGNLEKIDK
ncbi:RsfA family transcriptional regulator [Niallia sp. XMNu-256]|uniref:RsfA family transcriptional regulator n=1 Tax=Niallia sp. XMNu-256 TaxID=3082444 RepID=UPI0030D5FA46